jgi:hypothetical protein
MKLLEDHKSFEGRQQVWEHPSRETGTLMRFSAYLPPQAEEGACPVVWFLSGLTCNEQNFIIKSGFQRYAAELGLIVIGPDTSPRGPALDGSEIAGDPDGQEEIGPSAGYYLDATQPPWAPHYRMRSYVELELPEVVAAAFPADMNRQSMCGHSMGGHGALTISLRNPGRFRSTSALAPDQQPVPDRSRPPPPLRLPRPRRGRLARVRRRPPDRGRRPPAGAPGRPGRGRPCSSNASAPTCWRPPAATTASPWTCAAAPATATTTSTSPASSASTCAGTRSG